MGTVSIRTAVAADLDALRDVFRRSSLSNAGDREALLAHPEVLVWSGERLPEGWTTVAVDEHGAVLGFATAVPTDEGLELDDLFVDPDRMRRGVGQALVEDVAQTARRAGIRAVYVIANPHAAAFYTAVGFLPEGQADTPFGPARRMRLPL